MQLFTVTLEQMQRRKVSVSADTPHDALAMVAAVLPPGARALDAQPIGHPETTLGVAALQFILTRDFLDLAGMKNAPVEAWVRTGMIPDMRQMANAALSTAGLRIGDAATGPVLWIASAVSGPMLARWCDGRPFAGQMLHPALMTLPGATKPRSMTFAGIRARGVSLPLPDCLDLGMRT